MVAAGQIVRTRDIPRLIGRSVIDANSADIGTTETVVETISNITFENGRAFEIVLDTLYSLNRTDARGRIRVRKTNTSGAEYVTWFDYTVQTADSNRGISLRKKILNTSGSDVTMNLVLTLDEQSGLLTPTATIRLAGNSTNAVGYFEVWDIGDADDFPGINTVS